MRILFLTHNFPPEVNAPATRTFEHCVRWAKAGHHVTVVTCAPNWPNGVLYPGYENGRRRQVERVEGVHVVRVWTYLAQNAGVLRRIVNYLSYMLSATLASLRLPRPDVVVATSPQFFCGWAGVIVSRLKRAPLVLEIRDIWPESIRAVGAMRNRLLLRVLELLERLMYRSARHIVTVGSGYRDKILEKAGSRKPVSIVSNGVDLQRFALDLPHPRLPHMRDLDGRFVCSYVGTIGMAHGLEIVLEAAKVLREKGRSDICFCLVGDGALRKTLQDRAAQAELQKTVFFLGQHPQEDVPGILASSDACLIHLRKCPSFETVIPSKIFEAMAVNRPIIIGVRGPARDIVIEAQAGLEIQPGSAESLVRAVQMLADHPQIASRLGRRAREHVVKHYNRDVLAARFLRLLRSGARSNGLDPSPGTPAEANSAEKRAEKSAQDSTAPRVGRARRSRRSRAAPEARLTRWHPPRPQRGSSGRPGRGTCCATTACRRWPCAWPPEAGTGGRD